MLALGLALIPVYLFESGTLQISHFILLVFSALVYGGLGCSLPSFLFLLLLFSGYAVLVETIVAAFGGEANNLLLSLSFLYNFLISLAVYRYVSLFGARAISVGVSFSLIIAVLNVIPLGGVAYNTGAAARTIASFNNPNQLGFYSACILSLAYLLHRTESFTRTSTFIIYASALILTTFSLSKAAMISNFCIIAFAIWPKRANSNQYMLFFLSFLTLAILGSALFSGYFDDYLFVQRLLQAASENDSTLEARGYFVFFDYTPWQQTWGSGTGYVLSLLGREVHSTFISVLANYGLVGFGIFALVFLRWFKIVFSAFGLVGLICIAGPAMLYGLTHNGTRFTVFWILVAASAALPEYQSRKMLLRAKSAR
jgi:hypothetical protein